AQQQDKMPATSSQTTPEKQESFLEQERRKKIERTERAIKHENLHINWNPQANSSDSQSKKIRSFRFSNNDNQDTKRYADKSAFYLGLGYQLGNVGKTLTTTNYAIQVQKQGFLDLDSTISLNQEQHSSSSSSISNGVGIVLGYKWVGKHKRTKWSGFRWGLFGDLTASTYQRGSYFYNNTISATNSNEQIYQKNGDIKIITYGTYLDWLINAYNGDKFFAGFRLGVAFGGANYSVSDTNVYQSYLKQYVGGNLTYGTFQFLVNLGVRLGGRHNHFEFGVKIPTISDTYMQANTNKHKILSLLYGMGSLNAKLPYSVTFQRNFALYFNYIFSF
uniref:outer membrane protein n=1 Tax=Helicobacter cetorum TaxID=138563 RepID=UPI000CF038D4